LLHLSLKLHGCVTLTHTHRKYFVRPLNVNSVCVSGPNHCYISDSPDVALNMAYQAFTMLAFIISPHALCLSSHCCSTYRSLGTDYSSGPPFPIPPLLPLNSTRKYINKCLLYLSFLLYFICLYLECLVNM